MIDFSSWLDLPLIWGGLIATAIFLYVFLDGFDLGCGILLPFVPSEKNRTKIMNSIAPFWDGNETWLVLGGAGLFAVFPVAYAVLLPALYIPIILMLFGLIFRGIAFELRFKVTTGRQRKMWDTFFHGGSLLAAFMQGVILGNFVQGIEVEGRSYTGGPLDWANSFSVITGIALVAGYSLLGATWIIMKSRGDLQKWARYSARYVSFYVGISIIIVSITMPLISQRISELWFTVPNIYYLLPIPTLSVISFLLLWQGLNSNREYQPFILAVILFLLSYVGLIISIFPWIVPFAFTIWDAAAVATSQSFLLIGTVFLLPIVLIYTGYNYYVFRGKMDDEDTY